MSLLEYDKKIWDAGGLLFGFDEAGYGCFAGSMFIAGVIFEPFEILPPELVDVKDSKKLSEKKRYELDVAIRKHAKHICTIEVLPKEINNGNVYWLRYAGATTEAKKIAQDHANLTMVFDGNRALDLPGADSRFLIKGDNKSFSIAAASIIAKCCKDREMRFLNNKYPGYGFDKNKGYGTKEHQEALLKHGLTEVHRTGYCKKYMGTT